MKFKCKYYNNTSIFSLETMRHCLIGSHLSTNEVMKDKQIVVLYFKLAKVFDKLMNPYSLFIIYL